MKDLFKCFLNGLKLGIVVAFVLTVFYLVSAKTVQWSYIGVTLMFSVTIATFISFLIKMVDNYRAKYQPKNFYMIWALYYLAALIGMSVASEICLFILNIFILHIDYNLFADPKQLLINLIISLIVTTIVGVYQSQRTNLEIRLKEKELDIVKLNQMKTLAELQTLQSKINPHFLYNSLNSIASLIHIDADKAEEMTLKLSKLFRYSINTQNENFTSVKEEVEIIETYLDIERVRFGNRIQFILAIEEGALNESLPRFILQPLVENALKHGLNDMIDGGELKLTVEKLDGELTLTVADNGKPFPTELNSGYGLQSTYEKLQLLYGDKYSLQITNSPEKQIKITIPKL
ncbi:sensor histidine kinase [Pedobacter alpinus]|uniref:Sensor histidine kinase n=1 Tax=Pedobacter alpinus TaxID=1590643 RepID=A0ABW5TRG7_9SPHI